jgi:hypothetical protein
MEAMLGISLYSYPYLNLQKCFVFLIIVYTLSSTKLNIKAEQILPESEVGEREEAGSGGEMVQTMYSHMNKREKNSQCICQKEKEDEWSSNVML